MPTCVKLNFKDAVGKNLTISFDYANAAAGASVRPLMEGIVANGAIFSTAPSVIVSAEFVVTTVTPVNL